jgi:cysteine-rich secretory family protein
MSLAAGVLASAVAFAIAQPAHADVLTVVNSARTSGCAGQIAAGKVVASQKALNAVARELAQGSSLAEGMERIGYPAVSSTSFHVSGTSSERAVKQSLGQLCESVNDPRYTELGLFQSGSDTWVVLADRTSPLPVLHQPLVAERVLELVNAARSAPRQCGGTQFAAAQPVTLSNELTVAATQHSRDMAGNGVLAHRGADGSASGDRITQAGYSWSANGENVAAGQRDAESLVAGWLASPGQCATLMAAYYTEMGIAFALTSDTEPQVYWTQVFAAPLDTAAARN